MTTLSKIVQNWWIIVLPSGDYLQDTQGIQCQYPNLQLAEQEAVKIQGAFVEHRERDGVEQAVRKLVRTAKEILDPFDESDTYAASRARLVQSIEQVESWLQEGKDNNVR